MFSGLTPIAKIIRMVMRFIIMRYGEILKKRKYFSKKKLIFFQTFENNNIKMYWFYISLESKVRVNKCTL